MEVDLRFSLRDVCALAGVSHQSIRMYEKWNVLPKIAEEGNGYRYYHYPDLQRVIFLRYYASLGVSIKASSSLINGASMEDLEQVMKTYEKDIQKKIRFELASLDCIRRQKTFLKEIEHYEEKCTVEKCPAIYRLRCAVGGKLYSQPEVRRQMKEWSELFPVTMLSGISDMGEIEKADCLVSPGYAIYAEHADLLSDTNSPYIDYYPPVKSVRAIVRISSTAKDFYSMGEFVRHFMKENGLQPSGPQISISIVNKALSKTHPEDPSDYVCCWTPVK